MYQAVVRKHFIPARYLDGLEQDVIHLAPRDPAGLPRTRPTGPPGLCPEQRHRHILSLDCLQRTKAEGRRSFGLVTRASRPQLPIALSHPQIRACHHRRVTGLLAWLS